MTPTSTLTRTAAVRLEGVTRSFGAVEAVRGIDLTLEQGEVVAFLGPNGAGKTTTELFAWAVREGGVTNVIRHSGARSCEVVLSPTCVEVRDDGAGPPAASPAGLTVSDGTGLAGLRERAAAVGATMRVRALEPGFCLQVARP